MTEQQLLAAVTEMAGYLGIFCYHTHDSRRSDPGFPDLVLAGTRGVIFAELKTETGRVSHFQAQWRWRLLAAGAAWRLWRPADLQSGEILRELKGIT